MARTKISEFSSTAADNTDIDGIDIAEGCAPSGINNAIRTLMADLKDMQTGASGDTFTFASLNATTANIDGGTIDGATIGGSSAAPVSSTNLAYTGTLTGGTGVINIGSGQFYKDASGNVGLGTSAPQSKLTIQDTGGGAAISGIVLRNGDATNFHRMSVGYNSGSATGYIPASAVYIDGAAGGGYGALGGVAIGTGSSAPLVLGTNATERMRIDSSGNVGIGTSSPSDKLSIYNATGNTFVNVTNGSGTFLAGTYSDGTAVTGSTTSDPYIFLTNNTERMRVDSAGDLLVGTTSAVGPYSQKIGVLFNGGSYVGISIKESGSGSGSRFASFANSSNSEIGSITQNGTTAVAYNTSSDYRLKEQVTPMTGALAKNDLLNPVTYKWKADGSDGQGFIAHELQAVFPDAVTGEKDAVDDEGKPVYQGVDTSFLVGHLVACVKELTAELNNVKAELAILKGN